MHSRPRRTILHNKTADSKRFLCQLSANFRAPARRGFLEHPQVRQLERKEEMKPIHRTLRALRPTEDLIEGLAGIKGLTRSDLPERRLGAANTLTGPKGCCRQSWGVNAPTVHFSPTELESVKSERPDCSLLTNRT